MGGPRANSPGALPGPVWNHVATVLTKPDQQPTPPTKPSAFRTFSSNKLSPFLPTLRSAAAAPQEAPALDSRGGEGPEAENRSDWRRSSWLSPTQTQGLGPCLAKCAAGSRKGGPEPATAPVSLERCVLSGRQPCGQAGSSLAIPALYPATPPQRACSPQNSGRWEMVPRP